MSRYYPDERIDGRRAFDTAISSNAYLIERNGQATGVVCSLDYRHNTGTPVYLEEGLYPRLKPLDG